MKQWYKRWWAIVLYVIVGMMIIGSLLPNDIPQTKSETDKPTDLEIQRVEEFEEVLYLEIEKLFDKFDEENTGAWTQEMVLKEAEEEDALEDKIIREFAVKYGMTSEEFIGIIIRVNAYKYR